MALIDLSKDAYKFLSKLPPKQLSQLSKEIFKLAFNLDQPDIKELKGSKPGEHFYRKDAGEYRIIFKVYENTVKIVLVGKRNDSDVYKKFNRK